MTKIVLLLLVVVVAFLVTRTYADPVVINVLDDEKQQKIDIGNDWLPIGHGKLYKSKLADLQQSVFPVEAAEASVRRPGGGGSSSSSSSTVQADATWSNCGGDGSIVVHKLKVPSPVLIPGDNAIDIDLELMQDFDNIAVDLTMERRVAFWVTIPCIKDAGSCFYGDLCQLVSTGNSSVIDRFTKAGLTMCPFKKNRYTFATTITVPPLPQGVDTLVSGKYRLTAKLYRFPANVASKHLHMCLNMEFDIK